MSLYPHIEIIRHLVEVDHFTYHEVATHLTEILGLPERGTSIRNIQLFCSTEGIMRTAHRMAPDQRLQSVIYAARQVSYLFIYLFILCHGIFFT